MSALAFGPLIVRNVPVPKVTRRWPPSHVGPESMGRNRMVVVKLEPPTPIMRHIHPPPPSLNIEGKKRRAYTYRTSSEAAVEEAKREREMNLEDAIDGIFSELEFPPGPRKKRRRQTANDDAEQEATDHALTKELQNRILLKTETSGLGDDHNAVGESSDANDPPSPASTYDQKQAAAASQVEPRTYAETSEDEARTLTRSWTGEEHQRFLTALNKFGPPASRDTDANGHVYVGLGRGVAFLISREVGTRTPSQVRSHAQKYFRKQSRS
eukprot:574349-Hanusia_phi.AAC.3